ncbi:hypothetical protein D915_000262 [Fasciola hepatica]|uniref:G-protein coupled receptors family 1 profile domain-containing protein n=1 Tax=Fasciola hepatica TaxID=6192 RepID=A0A2H1CYG1_FASHE|nr:hypothetical protein D915_000262 [Fasciola hepatica]
MELLYFIICHIVTIQAFSCDQGKNFNRTAIDDWKAMHELVRLVCFQILIPCVCVIGITTNVMNIAVLARPRMRSSTNMYLLALAICDLVYSCILALMSLRTIRYLESSFTYMVTLPVQMAIGNLCSNMATWLTCAFTVERFVAITFPILARKICTRKRCKLIIGSLFLFTLFITLPDFFMKVVKRQSTRLLLPNPCNHSRISVEPDLREAIIPLPYRLSDSVFGEQLQNCGWPIILIVFVFIIPLLLLTVFNGLLIRSVVKNASNQKYPVMIRTNEKNSSFEHTRSSRFWALSFGRTSFETSFRREHKGSFADRDHIQFMPQNSQEILNQTTSFQSPKMDEAQLNESEKTRMEGEETEDDPGHTKSLPCRKSKEGRIKFPPLVGTGLSERHRITVMLIVVVVTFCIFTLPSAVIHLISELRTADNGIGDIKTRIAGNFANLALAINSSLNFFLYSCLSRRFRRTFRTLVNCRSNDL